MNQKKDSELAAAEVAPAYDAPAIEEIVTAEEMEREVHYAGDGTIFTG
jgi:hypothetical protein